jgi:hypothetical protein
MTKKIRKIASRKRGVICDYCGRNVSGKPVICLKCSIEYVKKLGYSVICTIFDKVKKPGFRVSFNGGYN